MEAVARRRVDNPFAHSEALTGEAVVLASTVESERLTNPLKANAFLGAIINQITVDPGLKPQLLTLVTHFRHLDPIAVLETTLPVTALGGARCYSDDGANIGDIDFPQQPSDSAVIDTWDTDALPAPIAPTDVEVRNITDIDQLAGHAAAQLNADGLHSVAAGDGTVPASVTETLVSYHPGDVSQALAVVDRLSGAVMLQAQPTVPAGAIDLDAGTDLTVAATSPAITSSAASAPPVAGSQTPSPAADNLQPWDPRACSTK